MFQLQRIEISGFKSFVEPVSTEFSDGITAIVGPNGCGKSNLSEAITWVLGEQSAKSLRGGKMEDVIFSGTAKRKPLGMAEVSLTLKVREDALRDPEAAESLAKVDAIEDGKLVIGRRVFRSGESQYRLNDKVVRLKEIKDILADTGLGVRAYSVIEQGKIGQILSGKPQERRKLIEEAAGITRYKARKRLAELKLEEATANRMRLDDILSEVESALRKLKRQSNAARRYKEREGEIRELAVVVMRGRWAQLCAILDEKENELTAARQRDGEFTAALQEREQEMAAARAQLEELGAQLQADHKAVADLGARIEGRQEFLRGSRQTLDEIAERLRDGDQLATQRQTEGEAHDTALTRLATEAASLLSERDQAQGEVSSDATRLAEAERVLAVAEAELESARSELMNAVAQVNTVQQRLHRAQIEEEKGGFRLERTQADLDEKLEQQRSAAADLEQSEHRLAELSQQLGAKAEQQAATKSELEKILHGENELNQGLERLRGDRGELQQRQKLLRELSEAETKRRESVRQAFVDLGVDQPKFLDEVIEVPAGWEGALDLYLESLHDVIVLPEEEDPLVLAREIATSGRDATLLAPASQTHEDLRARLAALEQADQRKPSRSLLASLVGVFRRQNEGGQQGADLGGLGEELGRALGLPASLANALPAAFLVETAEDALRYARRLRGVAFISRERVWARDGVVHVQSEKARPGLLGRARELEQLAVRLPQVQNQIEEDERTVQRLVGERSELAERSATLQNEHGQLQQEKAVAVARRQDARDRSENVTRQGQELEQRRAALHTELQQLAEDKAALQQQLDDAKATQAELDARFEQQQTKVEEAREQRNAIKSESIDRKGQLRVLLERAGQQTKEQQRLEGQRTEIARFLNQWQEERERLLQRSEKLAADVEAAKEEFRQATEERALAEDQRSLSQSRLTAQREAVQQLEQALQQLREQREESRNQLGELRVAQASHLQDAEHLREEYRDEFDAELPTPEELRAARSPALSSAPPAAASQDAKAPEAQRTDHGSPFPALRVVSRDGAPTSAADAASPVGSASDGGDGSGEGDATEQQPTLAELYAIPDDLDEQRAKLANLRQQLQKMGPVNVLAAEEYTEQEERFTFLSEQRADVQHSILNLRKTIEEINATSQERFLSTFAEVNEAFGQVFANLFRGGEASMRLLDEEDPIDSGIEIVARPPGKRLQNIQLMSGGEKALTAIALLFALFQTKPSPFCILDEVDAPLDDANILRFVDTLREMSRDTQFLVVTHNKLTMEAASCLYGVTMAEKGVSRLVGVDIDELHPQALTA